MVLDRKGGLVYRSRGTLRHIALPADVGALNYCAWSPDEQQIACAGYPPGGGPIAAWVVVNRKTLSAKGFPAAGLSLPWVR